LVAEPPDHDPLAEQGGWSEVRRIGGSRGLSGRDRLGGIGQALSRLDTEPRLLAALRNLRRRLPGDEKFGDPLSAAGSTSAAAVARGLAALRTPERESAVGELGLVGLQLWQSLSERTGRGRGDADLALMFTDLVDFSPYALAAGDTAAVELLVEVGRVVEDRVAAHGGRIQKRLGDGLLATFLDVRSAVEAALDAQEAIGEVQLRGYQPRMRVGVHWGRPRKLGGEMLGADVSLAASVGAAARGGQVLVSAPALSQLDAEAAGLRLGRRRRLRSPGAPQELHVASVRRRGAEEDGEDGPRRWRVLRNDRT
jgi:adenylate cyclase